MMFLEPIPDLALFILRLAVGIIFIAHGSEKLQRTKKTAQRLGLSTAQAFMLGAAEILAAASFILGILPWLGALIVVIMMLGAIYFKSQKRGKDFTGEGGWEFDFVLLAVALTILFSQPGNFTLLP